ncbi:unnamed protein product [Fraxinus pennsylvanica]|uniref:NmrA-like domain-containing protein n=1 Tax=Fraxinus pennsylvanica TaxID=56036 RepID=A0AAD2A2X3_9LAMI|nr:unnamed protein product [Fraxinus pennsylvanica]
MIKLILKKEAAATAANTWRLSAEFRETERAQREVRTGGAGRATELGSWNGGRRGRTEIRSWSRFRDCRHPTYAYVRPIKSNGADPSKIELLNNFKSMGVIIFQGELDEHEKLVTVLKQVDIVISTLAVPQHLEQLKIISAMKEAGNIKVN